MPELPQDNPSTDAGKPALIAPALVKPEVLESDYGVSARQLAGAVKAKKVRRYRIGRTVVYDRAEVEAWIRGSASW